MPLMDRLARAAALFGIEPEYLDAHGRLVRASPETLLRLLQVRGAPVAGIRDVPGAVRARQAAQWGQMLEPVLVAWEGRLDAPLRMAASAAGRFSACIRCEDGATIAWSGRMGELPVAARKTVDGRARVELRLCAQTTLPSGYHELTVRAGRLEATALVISAPLAAYQPESEAAKWWGVFLPLYALRRRESWGAGDFSDLGALMQWAAGLGGNLVATLPILAPVDMAADPSPYAPTSRFFWNEFYLDLRAIPEMERSPRAQKLVEAIESGDALRAIRRKPLVDYAGLLRLKRPVLEALAETFFSEPSSRRGEYERFLRENPRAEEFARFRAAAERHGSDWTSWPAPMRDGRLLSGDYGEAVHRYHLYAQWQTAEQLQEAVRAAEAHRLFWYFDYPLGVSGTGFDVWREPELFVRRADAGAPPDLFFTRGQNWCFPPLDPDRLRQARYGYFIEALRRHLRYAKVLRIDHVMGLYRLYWIPTGLPATDGAYVRYPVDELLAILVLESHRHRALVVGENLGTVPAEVDAAMARHQIAGMHVLQFAVSPRRRKAVAPAPARAVASLNTHDLPTFTGYLRAKDIDDRLDLGLLGPKEAARQRRQRAACRKALVAELARRRLLGRTEDDPAITEASLAMLGASDAAAVLVNLEDLWGETRQQNTPGTVDQRPNWRRPARYPLERFTRLRAVQRALRRLAQARRQGDSSTQ